MKEFTHLNESGKAAMVDVSTKKTSRRSATARSMVVLPDQLKEFFSSLDTNKDILTKKGAVFQTAIIAGIMAAKKTGELIPLCHPLGLDSCDIHIGWKNENELQVDCTVCVEAKTGVEMEALVGASVAALTIYDMCKAFSHDIVIRETMLISKTGGKNDFERK